MGKADLHIHSTASDGNSTPSQIVKMASEENLGVIALTDHDTFVGYPEALKEGNKRGVRVLPGVEITCNFNDRECHLLAYCFDPGDSALIDLLKKHKQARLERAEWIIKQLSEEGLELDIDEVKAQARGGNVGRPHIAAVMIKKGYVADAKEAFIRFLGDRALDTLRNYYTSLEEVIRVVKESGGATVLAHPGVLYNDKEVEEIIKAGIDGIEVVHPSHNHERQKRYEQLASEHHLLVTGGSDYHGVEKDYYRYFGVSTVSKSRVSSLIQMTEQRKQISV